MRIEHAYPPVWDRIKAKFPNVNEKAVVVTYGETLFIPGGGMPDSDLLVHEQTHTIRQLEYGIEKWWDRYFEDDDFRLNEERLAYREQYKNFCRRVHNRDKRAAFAGLLARDLSQNYALDIDRPKATKLITEGIK